MVVDDRPITPDAFAAWTSRLLPEIERTGASFFEATTAIAFADFAARTADIAVIEVGLGGRLDSTNVVDPIASAVTRVAVEHTEYLGSGLDQIAREKAGIAKAGRPFVVGEVRPEIAAQLENYSLEAGAIPVRLGPLATYDGPLGLFGKHQRQNAAVAAKLLEQLPHPWRPDADAVSRGFARASFPGRFDRRGKWLFDVAHNTDAIAVLLQTLDQAVPPPPLHGLVCVLGDKDWRTMLSALLERLDRIWVTQAPTAPLERRWDLTEVAECFSQRVETEPDFDLALKRVVIGAETVVVCGSFHTVGDAMARLPGFAPLG
jgi:dihydrofolate synthase/folylpolyglutamate synthase